MIINKVNHQGGFTLLEVMVALSIVAVATIGTFNVFAVANKAVDSAREQSKVSRWVASHLAELDLHDQQPGVSQGQYDKRYRWQLTIIEHEVSKPFVASISSTPIAHSGKVFERQKKALESPVIARATSHDLLRATLIVESLSTGQTQVFNQLLLTKVLRGESYVE